MRYLPRSFSGVDSKVRDDRRLHLSHVLVTLEKGDQAEQFEGAVCRKDRPERRPNDDTRRQKEYWTEI